MKTVLHFRLSNLIFALAALLVCLCVHSAQGASNSAADKNKELTRKHDTTGFYAEKIWTARKTGRWESSDVWWTYDPLDGQEKAVKAKGRMESTARDDGDIVGGNTVTLSSKAQIRYFRIYHEKSKLVIANKGHLLLHGGYYAHRGASKGGIEVLAGGHLESVGRIILAGANNTDTGIGTFSQTGGTVVARYLLTLTGDMTQSSSPQAIGIYTLSGGVLKISGQQDREGITQGVGTGTFSFEGGTLDANNIAIDLDNSGRGNLSPGGDERVGKTVLVPETVRAQYFKSNGKPFDEARTYTQGRAARMNVNIASRHRYDQLEWTTPEGKGSVVLKDGTTVAILPLYNYKVPTGAKVSLDVIKADKLELEGKLNIEQPGGFNFSYEVIDGKTLRLKTGN